MKEPITIQKLIEKDVVFIGSDWVEDDSITEGPFPGWGYNGEKTCVDCNDLFFWGVADGEDINTEDLPDFQKAIKDCDGDLVLAGYLFCCRRRKMRPQGAIYTYIPKEIWHVFNQCGPERTIRHGNPFRPGEYKPKLTRGL